jgi:hypothetical protein
MHSICSKNAVCSAAVTFTLNVRKTRADLQVLQWKYRLALEWDAKCYAIAQLLLIWQHHTPWILGPCINQLTSSTSLLTLKVEYSIKLVDKHRQIQQCTYCKNIQFLYNCAATCFSHCSHHQAKSLQKCTKKGHMVWEPRWHSRDVTWA